MKIKLEKIVVEELDLDDLDRVSAIDYEIKQGIRVYFEPYEEIYIYQEIKTGKFFWFPKLDKRVYIDTDE